MDTKQKYVRTKNGVIIFNPLISHDTFKGLNPTTAGFCYVGNDEVSCFGDSFSLNLKSDPKEDSFEATKQIFGFDAAFNININQPPQP